MHFHNYAGKALRLYAFLLIGLAFILGGCETTEKVLPVKNESILEISVMTEKSGALRNAQVELFTSEEEWRDPASTAAYQATTNEVGMVKFTNLSTQKYWFRVTKTDLYDYTYYHNQERDYVLDKPLPAGARTTLTIKVKSRTVKKVTLKRYEVTFIPAYFNRIWDTPDEHSYTHYNPYATNYKLTDATGPACDLYSVIKESVYSNPVVFQSPVNQYKDSKAEDGPFVFAPNLVATTGRSYTIYLLDHEFLDAYRSKNIAGLNRLLDEQHFDYLPSSRIESFSFSLHSFFQKGNLLSVIEQENWSKNCKVKFYLEWDTQ